MFRTILDARDVINADADADDLRVGGRYWFARRMNPTRLLGILIE